MLIDLIGLILLSARLNRHNLDFVTKPLASMFAGILALLFVEASQDSNSRLYLVILVFLVYSFLTLRLIVRDDLFGLIKSKPKKH